MGKKPTFKQQRNSRRKQSGGRANHHKEDGMRLQKYLSKAGVCSRRAGEELMLDGRVSVNGDVVFELGTRIDPDRDRVEVDGKQVSLPNSFIYLLMNKPPNVITSLEDPEGRAVITDLLPEKMPRVWPVGRLDWDSEGVILLTNDGKLTHLLTHPSHDVTKEYAVKVQGIIARDSPKLEQLRNGVDIGDGEITQPAHVHITGDTGRNTWLEVTIAEGKNRQVRRMFDAIGHSVMKLRRLRIGSLTIEGLASGTYRSLLSDEVVDLYNDLEASIPERAKPSKRQLKRERSVRERR
ncbi:MAG: pseudouridine synthase [Myxococcota bacterium]|jgi:pseudouridine synthase|nr:pseudouridine synthase [Myxococcota bacterium]MEC9442259.1 pseudouridine synthase [Myxococcota bacterium]